MQKLERKIQVRANCPRCGGQGVAFEIIDGISWKKGTTQCRDEFGCCGLCGRSVILTYDCNVNRHGVIPDKLIEVAPALPPSDAPRHTPEPIANYFKQGKDAATRQSWDAAGMMFGKALEVGLKAKFPDMDSSLTTFKRIEQAASENKLTPDLVKWAHQIRDLRNDATHEQEPFTEARAREIADFTEIMLQYMFRLPGDLKTAQDAAKKREKKSGT